MLPNFERRSYVYSVGQKLIRPR